MKLEKGEIITLDNNEEYICANIINYEGTDYVYLISNFKPVKVKFARVKYLENNNLSVVLINDQKQKQALLGLFAQSINSEQEINKVE